MSGSAKPMQMRMVRISIGCSPLAPSEGGGDEANNDHDWEWREEEHADRHGGADHQHGHHDEHSRDDEKAAPRTSQARQPVTGVRFPSGSMMIIRRSVMSVSRSSSRYLLIEAAPLCRGPPMS